ncbi:MAG: hypothetical protein GC164_16440 [Phycisphaera sp.]|nr:hypothetical protein [Phycisphaera sp.]
MKSLLLIVWLSCTLTSPILGQQIIAQKGDAIPGGFRIDGISRAVISSAGHVAFIATAERTPKSLPILALVGQAPAPDAPFVWHQALVADVPPPGAPQDAKLLLTLTTTLHVTPSGWLVAHTPVHLKRAGPSRVDAVVLSDGKTVQTLALPDHPMSKPLSQWLLSAYRLEVQGESIALGAQCRKGENPSSENKHNVILMTKAGQAPTVACAQGDAIASVPAKLDMGSIGLHRVAVTESGEVYFADVIGPNHNAILTAQPGKPARVVLAARTPAPVANRTFARFANLSAGGDVLAFYARLDSTQKGDYSQVHGCFYRDAGGKVNVIVKGGDPLPGHEGKAVDHHQPIFDQIVSRDGRYILVRTITTRPGPNKHGSPATLLFDTQTRKLATVVYEGMPAPAPHQAVTLDKFSDVQFNAAGHVVFKSMGAVWAGKPDRLTRIVAEGEELKIGDATFSPKSIGLTGQGRGGDASALNDAGQLVLQFTDKSRDDVLVLFSLK